LHSPSLAAAWDDEQGNRAANRRDNHRDQQRERNRLLDYGASQRGTDGHPGKIQAHRDGEDTAEPARVRAALAQREEANINRATLEIDNVTSLRSKEKQFFLSARPCRYDGTD